MRIKKLFMLLKIRIVENFEIIKIDLERIVMKLPNKKNTEEEITNVKSSVPQVKEQFIDIINNSLKKGSCPEE